MRGLAFASLCVIGKAGDSTATTCKHMKDAYGAEHCCGQPTKKVPLQIVPHHPPGSEIVGANPCEAKNPNWANVDCYADGAVAASEQAGGDVTGGFEGEKETDIVPITETYFSKGLCPVNVHWHLGAEHRSEGQYDEYGKSPELAGTPNQPYTAPRRLGSNTSRRLGADAVRYGFACHHYNADDPKFTTEYNWQHCLDMHVGVTYEVHWPSSALGACNTPYQYQSKFYDGVFCRYDGAGAHKDLTQQDIANSVGVQSQVFTIVNDEDYYYPNLMRGMIVNSEGGGDFGKDLGIYTGSSTGTSRDNVKCSAYTPITWQVDRKCHLISASSFDKMCADMKQNFDDMSMDLHPHGARSLVDKALNANNLADGNHQVR